MEHIVKDNNLNYSFVSIENNPYKINFAYENYLKKYSKKIDKNLMYFNYVNNTELPDNIWLIYFTDITNEKFIKPIELKDYTIIYDKIFNHLELYRLEKTD